MFSYIMAYSAQIGSNFHEKDDFDIFSKSCQPQDYLSSSNFLDRNDFIQIFVGISNFCFCLIELNLF
jgi:hypothetical protein